MRIVAGGQWPPRPDPDPGTAKFGDVDGESTRLPAPEQGLVLTRINPGGGPTPDKPDVTLAPPEPGGTVSAFMNVRVADIAAFYAAATAKGAQFLTEPIDRRAELRRYLRDPDGCLIEVGQATGMLEGIFADRSPK